MPISIDDQEWPLVRCRWGRPTTDRDVEDWFDTLGAFLERGERFAVIVDARFSDLPKPAQRAYMAARIKEQADRSGDLMIQGLVFGSPVQRSTLNILNAIVKQPYPQRVFGTVAAAEAWVRSQLRIRPRATM